MKRGFGKYWTLLPAIIMITIAGVFLTNIVYNKINTEEAVSEYNSGVVQREVVELHTEEEYLEFAKSVNEGNQYENFEIVLCEDLDFSNYEKVEEIGVAEKRTRNFLGTFDGNGHKISGVRMFRPEGYAGLFVNLRGTVKNLIVENCTFSGQVCGAIASDTTSAVILNCYVDAKCAGDIAGDIVGVLDGTIDNCVAATENFAEEIKAGKVSNCYRIGQEDILALNNNLFHISGRYENVSFCQWEETSERLLGLNKANLIETITGTINIRGEQVLLNAYYSAVREQWCVALPAKHKDVDIVFELKSSNGEQKIFSRESSEEEIYFEWNHEEYPLTFLCAENIDTIYVSLDAPKTLEHIHANKDEIAMGHMTIFHADGDVSYMPFREFYGHGNGSWSAIKKSYNMKLDAPMDLLNMGANDDFVFLAGYRDDSLMSYVATTELVREIGFEYAPEFRLVNLYVSGEYIGVYFLTEKVEIDTNRIEIDSVYSKSKALNGAEIDLFRYCEWKDDSSEAERYYYNVKKNPDDITGGYLLEADVEDYAANDSRFVSERGLQFTLKRARCTSKEQMDYIADFWQEFEDALFAEKGYNQFGKHYSEYIDLESFAMQWLIYELEEESSLNSSIYFYKESDVSGDGLLHACYPWDMEHSYVMDRDLNLLWMEWFDQFKGYWTSLWSHEDFRLEVYRVWKEKFVPAIEKMIDEEPTVYDSGLKNLSWYRDYIVEISDLENSRWEMVNPWNRCAEIRFFLTRRMLVLSEKFESVQNAEY